MGYWQCPRCGGTSSYKQREQKFTNNYETGGVGVRNTRETYCYSCMSVKMDYRLSPGDWKVIRWVASIFVIVLFIGALGNALSSEKPKTASHSTTSKSKEVKSKSQGSEKVKIMKVSPAPVVSESDSPEPTDSRSEYYFEWPPTASTRVSGEGGATIMGNWQQVPGSENWYYLIEDEWYSCGGGSSYCQLTWWVSNQECAYPNPRVEFVRGDGQAEGGSNWHGRYSKPYFAVWGFSVLIGSSESTYKQNKVIPEKDKYIIKSMSCN